MNVIKASFYKERYFLRNGFKPMLLFFLVPW